MEMPVACGGDMMADWAWISDDCERPTSLERLLSEGRRGRALRVVGFKVGEPDVETAVLWVLCCVAA